MRRLRHHLKPQKRKIKKGVPAGGLQAEEHVGVQGGTLGPREDLDKAPASQVSQGGPGAEQCAPCHTWWHCSPLRDLHRDLYRGAAGFGQLPSGVSVGTSRKSAFCRQSHSEMPWSELFQSRRRCSHVCVPRWGVLRECPPGDTCDVGGTGQVGQQCPPS